MVINQNPEIFKENHSWKYTKKTQKIKRTIHVFLRKNTNVFGCKLKWEYLKTPNFFFRINIHGNRGKSCNGTSRNNNVKRKKNMMGFAFLPLMV